MPCYPIRILLSCYLPLRLCCFVASWGLLLFFCIYLSLPSCTFPRRCTLCPVVISHGCRRVFGSLAHLLAFASLLVSLSLCPTAIISGVIFLPLSLSWYFCPFNGTLGTPCSLSSLPPCCLAMSPRLFSVSSLLALPCSRLVAVRWRSSYCLRIS